MKSALFAKVLVLTAALAITLTPGCRRKAKPFTPLPSRMDIEDPSVSGPADLDTQGIGLDGPLTGSDLGGSGGGSITPNSNLSLGGEPLPRDRYTADSSFFAANVLYFDFDSAVVKSSEKGKVTAVADYLRSNPNVAVEVEGHCDERGTEEYNRSLGERRALAVREEIALQGIDPRRVYTISYGEDRPAVDGQNESAWSRNRRSEFILLTPR